jgi:hypothetical protein
MGARVPRSAGGTNAQVRSRMGMQLHKHVRAQRAEWKCGCGCAPVRVGGLAVHGRKGTRVGRHAELRVRM